MFHDIITMISLVSLNVQRIERLEQTVRDLNTTSNTIGDLRGRIENLERKLAFLNSTVEQKEITEATMTTAAPVTRSAEELRRLKREGWRLLSNGYFLKFFESGDAWFNANRTCRRNGGLLASVVMRDADIRREVFEHTVANIYWIGLSDSDEEGIWMWEDGVESSGDDVDWQDGEPNNSRGSEDCGLYQGRVSGSWSANDDRCRHVYKYICEMTPGP